MNASGNVVAASLVRHWLDWGSTHGLPPDQLAQAAGIAREALSNGEDWLPAALVEHLLHAALALAPDPLFGLHLARASAPANFGVVGFILQTCANLRDAMTMVSRYEGLVSDIGLSTLRHEPGAVLWCWECNSQDPVFLRHASEYVLAAWAGLVRLLAGGEGSGLLAVHFRHPAPPHEPLAEMTAAFPCPVSFNQMQSALILAPAALTRPFRHANPRLQETLETHAQELLQGRERAGSLREQAKSQLYLLLRQGNASRELLAEQLCMSSRSLHRQLQKEGTNYHDLLDELRQELARQYLRDRSVEDTALRLGFQESQSFIRWFRRLQGCTPGEFQRGGARA